MYCKYSPPSKDGTTVYDAVTICVLLLPTTKLRRKKGHTLSPLPPSFIRGDDESYEKIPRPFVKCSEAQPSPFFQPLFSLVRKKESEPLALLREKSRRLVK